MDSVQKIITENMRMVKSLELFYNNENDNESYNEGKIDVPDISELSDNNVNNLVNRILTRQTKTDIINKYVFDNCIRCSEDITCFDEFVRYVVYCCSRFIGSAICDLYGCREWIKINKSNDIFKFDKGACLLVNTVFKVTEEANEGLEKLINYISLHSSVFRVSYDFIEDDGRRVVWVIIKLTNQAT